MRNFEDELVKKVLHDYSNSDVTTQEIGKLYGVCPSSITGWAKKAGITLRPRGRKKLDRPSARHLRILEMAQTMTLEHIGAKMGTKKQNIHRIVQRWKGWKPPTKAPFQPGDKVVWNGKTLTFVSGDAKKGIFVDPKTDMWYRDFVWGGELPVKVG